MDTEAALKCPYFSHKEQLKTENIKINISKTPKVEEKADKLRASKFMARHGADSHVDFCDKTSYQRNWQLENTTHTHTYIHGRVDGQTDGQTKSLSLTK